MPDRRSIGPMLVFASGLHLLAFAILVRLPLRERSHVEPTPIDIVAIDVAPTPAPETPEVPMAAEPPRLPSAASDLPAAAVVRRDRPTATPIGSAVALPEEAPATPHGWTLPVGGQMAPAPPSSAALATLGLGAVNPFMGRRKTPEDEVRAAHEQANRAAGEAMRAAMHDNDVALGLGGGGPVVSAVEEAVRDGMGADEGRAVLIAVADASGVVLRVDIESSSDSVAFQGVADELLKRLQGKHVRVPAGARGLAMRINVESHMANPSGGTVGLDPRSAGAHFDIADLGARAKRVIHARVLAEQVL